MTTTNTTSTGKAVVSSKTVIAGVITSFFGFYIAAQDIVSRAQEVITNPTVAPFIPTKVAGAVVGVAGIFVVLNRILGGKQPAITGIVNGSGSSF